MGLSMIPSMSTASIPRHARLHPEFAKLAKEIQDGTDLNTEEQIKSFEDDNHRFYAQVDVPSVIKRLQGIASEMGKSLVNRDLLTQQGIRALITGEHQFIFSGAGVAKSLYANQMFSYFKNASTFSIQFCPDTTPDDLFGSYDIERFKKGNIHHNVEGSIITHPFAFLDEFMDGNDKLLRSLLGVLLERRFIAGNQVEEAVLHTAIATSNYMRVSETTEALLDRFLYKAFISPSKDMFTLLRIDNVYHNHAGAITKPNEELLIDVREIIALRQMIQGKDPQRKIECPIEINYLKNMVAASFESELKKYRSSTYLSPRTISKSNDLLKANALLAGRDKVNESDVEHLFYLFCTLDEPLNEDKSLLSQDLFKRVFRSRVQYFHAIKKELRPLLLTFEFMNGALKDPAILKRPFEQLQQENESWMGSLVDSLRGLFLNHDEIAFENQRQSFLKLIEPCGHQNQDLRDFREKLLALIDLVYQRSES